MPPILTQHEIVAHGYLPLPLEPHVTNQIVIKFEPQVFDYLKQIITIRMINMTSW